MNLIPIPFIAGSLAFGIMGNTLGLSGVALIGFPLAVIAAVLAVLTT